MFKAVEDALKSLKEYALFKFARPRGAADGPHPCDYGDIVVYSRRADGECNGPSHQTFLHDFSDVTAQALPQ